MHKAKFAGFPVRSAEAGQFVKFENLEVVTS